MQDPREDIKDVVRGLLDRPSLKQQAETVQKYCTPNVKFYYLYFNTVGRDEMTVIYQLAQVIANYRGVIIEEIHYDEKTNVVGLWSQVLMRPWPLYWNGTTPLSKNTVVELEDVEVDKGKRVVKMIRDYFEFSPIIRVIPFVGKIYANRELRFVLGWVLSTIVIAGFKFVKCLLPTELGQFIFG